jgi:hypothetical protein
LISKNKILSVLPEFKNSEIVLKKKQGVEDIVKGILKTHNQYFTDYDLISDFFYRGNIEDTCKYIFDFLKKNVPYEIESENYQTLRSPGAILHFPGDCKSFALFSNGVLDSLRRKGKLKCDLIYRFAGYGVFTDYIEHVFCVCKTGKNEIWVDPVLNNFDEKKKPNYQVDKKINNMALVGISGIYDAIGGGEIGAVPQQFVGRPLNPQPSNPQTTSTQNALSTVSDLAELVPGWGTAISSVLKIFKGFGNVPNPNDWQGWAALDSRGGFQIGTNAATWVLQDGDSTQNEAVNLISWINNYGIETIVNENPHIKARFGKFITVQDLANKLKRAGFTQEADDVVKAATTQNLPGTPGAMTGGTNMFVTLALVGAGIFAISKFAKK